jgi:hypothetical protein
MCYLQGSIVVYKGDFWIVMKDQKSSPYIRIMRPHVGNEKREITASKAQPTGFATTEINYKGKDVLVTRKGMLISLVSERLLKNTTADGKAMLELARAFVTADPIKRDGFRRLSPLQYNANGVRIGRLIDM